MRYEINCDAVLRTLRARGIRTAIPVHEKHSAPLRFYEIDDGTLLTASHFSVQVPDLGSVPVREMRHPELVLVPLLGFDAELYRIGYGKGYYDKTIEEFRRNSAQPPVFVGLAHEYQLRDTVHANEFDQRLDVVVTETRVRSRA